MCNSLVQNKSKSGKQNTGSLFKKIGIHIFLWSLLAKLVGKKGEKNCERRGGGGDDGRILSQLPPSPTHSKKIYFERKIGYATRKEKKIECAKNKVKVKPVNQPIIVLPKIHSCFFFSLCIPSKCEPIL